MKKVLKCYAAIHDDGPLEGPHKIHIVGVPLIGSDTLCGHTARTTWEFKTTTKKPNCVGCLAIWNFCNYQSL